MINENHYCVYDFETDGKDPRSCSAIEIGATIVHARKHQVIEGSEFQSFIKPDDFDDTYFERHKDTIIWAAGQRKCSTDDVIALIANAPPEKVVFKNFTEYLKKYKKEGGKSSNWDLPILVGYNSSKFDDVIYDRMCAKYGGINAKGEAKSVCPRLRVDLLHHMFMWHESLSFLPSYSMDTLRQKIAFSEHSGHAHAADRDVAEEAELLCKLLKIYRKFGAQVKWGR